MTIFIYLALFMFGAALGSFAGAQVWRLRARQLKQDKDAGEAVDRTEYRTLKPLMGAKGLSDRSIDFTTGKKLKWYDMIPVLSWIILRGKSRYSGKPIGMMEFLLEVFGGAIFVASYALWPFELVSAVSIAAFVIWLAILVCLMILFAYDQKWFLLPDSVTIVAVILAGVFAVLQLSQVANIWESLFSLLGAFALLPGLYLALFLFSRWRFGEEGTWVGFGDIKLGVVLALIVLTWQQGFIALFAANLIGSILVIGAMVAGKVHMKDRVPFGPLLIAGAIISFFFGADISAWFSGLSF